MTLRQPHRSVLLRPYLFYGNPSDQTVNLRGVTVDKRRGRSYHVTGTIIEVIGENLKVKKLCNTTRNLLLQRKYIKSDWIIYIDTIIQ